MALAWFSEHRQRAERARQRSDESFAKLFASASEGIVIVNESGCITSVNERAEQMFGYPRGELIGQAVEQLVPLPMRERHVQHRTHYAGQPQIRSMGAGRELRAARKDGTEFPVQISLSYVRGEQGLPASLAATLIFVGPAQIHADATPTVTYAPAPQGQTLQVDGTSNIHDWSVKTDRINGSIELPGQWRQANGGLRLDAQLQPAAQSRLQVSVPVRSLASDKSGLNDKMYGAMNTRRHHDVTFVLTSVSPQQTPPTPAGAVTWEAAGDLTIAGTTRSVKLDLPIEPMPNDQLKITVEKALKMTDFGIDPPTAMFGVARSADAVTVKATWILQRQTPQPIVPAVLAPDAYRQQTGQMLEAYGRVQQALADNAWPRAQDALSMLTQRAGALAELDHAQLPEAQREVWQTVAARLQGAVASAAEARTLASGRASFVVLTQAVAATPSRTSVSTMTRRCSPTAMRISAAWPARPGFMCP